MGLELKDYSRKNDGRGKFFVETRVQFQRGQFFTAVVAEEKSKQQTIKCLLDDDDDDDDEDDAHQEADDEGPWTPSSDPNTCQSV